MYQLSGKVALVTGGSKGIGFATASLLASQGAKVIISGRDKNALDAAVKSIDGEVCAFQCDITSAEALDKLFEQVSAKYSKIDILFANAGKVTGKQRFEDISQEDFDEIINVNYKGTFFSVQKAVPYLNKDASIILNASIAGTTGFYYSSLYSSTKAAIIQLAKNLAAELAQSNIRVNAISPGYVKTAPWNKASNGPIYEAFSNEVPLQKRFASLDEIAKTVLFLASDTASYITGQNIVVDGGLTVCQKQCIDERI